MLDVSENTAPEDFPLLRKLFTPDVMSIEYSVPTPGHVITDRSG
jgi:hypothetical protein